MIARRHRHTMTTTTLQRYLTVDQRQRREWIFDHPHLKYLFATCGAVVHDQRSREHSTLMRKSVWPAFLLCGMWNGHFSTESDGMKAISSKEIGYLGRRQRQKKNVNSSWVLGEKKFINGRSSSTKVKSKKGEGVSGLIQASIALLAADTFHLSSSVHVFITIRPTRRTE